MPNPQALASALQSYDGPTMRAYEPSWRDRLASALMGDSRATPERSNFVSGLVGSRGLGSTGNSVADFTPAGAVLQGQEAARSGDAKGVALAAIGALPGVGAAERAVNEVAPAVERGIIAYHGSPHSFDKFDMSKIGTGEGAQAYGHGLYFAESEPVAKSYRDANQTYDTFVNGERVTPEHPLFQPIMHIGANGYDAALKRAEEFAAAGFVKPQEVDAIRSLKGAKIEQKPAGSMYQVRINADPDHFLDWDKPLSEQTGAVKSVLGVGGPTENLGMSNGLREFPLGDAEQKLAHEFDARKRDGYVPERMRGESGQDFYNFLRNRAYEGGDAHSWSDESVAAAKALRDAGIPGIKYLDQGSRGAGEGSRNYVVFDDNLVEILKKYGLVGLLGGGAAMGAANQGQEAPGL
jgi:ADP-Ribosyltransferase in polyvalent proteins